MLENTEESVLELKNLSFSFHTYGGVVKAVRDVSFTVRPGEILGVVGESGCGKSVTAQCILKLNPPKAGFFEGGSILYKGEDIVSKSNKEMRKIRGEEIGFVFQDPMTSLNPTMKIGKQIGEIIKRRRNISKQEINLEVKDVLEKVGISDPLRRMKQYPHELSGGMKQRVMIAMALIGKPKIIIADEPTTSLDVTIESQILKLFKKLSREFHISVILITHDLGVIAKLCDRVLVMYGGKILERASVEELFYKTAHPYTRGLLSSIATLDTDKHAELKPIDGSPPDLFSPPPGCPFAPRCEFGMNVCHKEMPQEIEMSNEHTVCCWLQDQRAPRIENLFQREGGSGNGREDASGSTD